MPEGTVKAILVFDLPEDAAEHRTACQAGVMASALWDVRESLRRRRKYGIGKVGAEELLEQIWNEFNDATDRVDWWEG